MIMARRRRRRGFGSSEAIHRGRARGDLPHARQLFKQVRAAISDGNCNQAIRTLAAAAYNMGKVRANRLGAGMKDSAGSSGIVTIRLARRVAKKCAR